MFTIRQVSSLIGSLTSSFPGVEFGQLHYRHIESDKNYALKENFGNFEAKMTLSDNSLTDLEWWMQNLNTAQRKISHGHPAIVSFTDASKTGWGRKLKMVKVLEVYGQKMRHINSLELLAVKFSLISLLHGSHSNHVRIMSDNTTAVSYINEMGGCKSPQCNDVTKEIWKWAMARNIWLSAAHIPGCI